MIFLVVLKSTFAHYDYIWNLMCVKKTPFFYSNNYINLIENELGQNILKSNL